MFLIWYDDSKKPTTDKIAAGIQAYRDRFSTAPACALVNEADLAVVSGIRVESRSHIPRNNFWLGQIVEEGRK